MEHAILVYLALALVAYPFLFLIYEIWRHGGAGQTVPYVPGLWSKVCKRMGAPRISGLGRMMPRG